MAAARVIEPVDILEDRALGLTACVPTVAPNQLGFDGFEEPLNHRMVIAITFPTHPLPGSGLLANAEYPYWSSWIFAPFSLIP